MLIKYFEFINLDKELKIINEEEYNKIDNLIFIRSKNNLNKSMNELNNN